jgi:hypothetical protein
MQPAKRYPRSLNPREWPGEREPTRDDVREVNENLEATFLQRFRVALLHNEGFDDDATSAPESAADSSVDQSPVSEDSQQKAAAFGRNSAGAKFRQPVWFTPLTSKADLDMTGRPGI